YVGVNKNPRNCQLFLHCILKYAVASYKSLFLND
ncbi:MAG: hypothetical protein ACI9RV_001456, partial [Glaciecola sp.]